MRIGKTGIKFLLTLCLVSMLWPLSVKAAGGNMTGELMIALGEVEAKESPDNASQTVISYADGAAVFVTGMKNGWYQVMYQGIIGYVPTSKLKKLELGDLNGEIATADGENDGQAEYEETQSDAANQNTDAGNQAYVDALNEEMAAVEAENSIIIEEVERQRGEKKSSIVWAVIIGVLIVGIFVTGLIDTVKENRNSNLNK